MSDQPTPTPLGLAPSFGYGDRLGLATPGHLASLRNEGGPIRGIFAQQSIREMNRTGRTAKEVMQAAVDALAQAGYTQPWGADGDHLKTEADVDVTAEAGFTFFTIDPSDHVDGQTDNYDAGTLGQHFDRVKGELDWLSQYEGQTVQVPEGPTIEFDERTLQRAAVKYGRAIAHSLKLAGYIDKVLKGQGREYEIELSVDETPQPTTAAEHYIIADQCRRAGMKLVSLAPRYVGDFEKGIDFKGDVKAFEKSLSDHAAIARHLGPYKLSLHSGSDKLSVYPAFARITRGQFHVKTAGTSYLEALRVAARQAPELFGRIVEHSRSRFDEDRASYHISAEKEKVPGPGEVGEAELERLYLDENDGRQILHVTFGSVLTDATFSRELKQVLAENPQTHEQVLAEHLGKHLARLREGMGG